VLLTDIAMPGEDGYSLIGKVRRLDAPGPADMPAAADIARDEDRQEALQAAFRLHLAKPIDSRSLVEPSPASSVGWRLIDSGRRARTRAASGTPGVDSRLSGGHPPQRLDGG